MKTLLYTAAVTATLTQLVATPLFNSCKSCHGALGEKVAMGKSKVIADLNATQIESALRGYKDGSYGGVMKALMRGQVMRLSAEDIKALAEYIPTLK